MIKKDISILDLDRSVKRFFGEFCWEVTWTNLTNLSLEFGRPSTQVIREPRRSVSNKKESRRIAGRRLVSVSGYWHLWVYFSHWRIIRSGVCLATGASSYRKKHLAMGDLKGQRLIDIRIIPATGATRFQFDLDTVLEVRRFSSRSEDELWLLYERDKYVRTLHGDGTFHREKLNEKGGAETGKSKGESKRGRS